MKRILRLLIYILITVTATIQAADLVIDGTTKSMSGDQRYDNVTVKGGGILNVTGSLKLTANTITVMQGSQILANGAGNNSQGRGKNNGYWAGSGGGYGGAGGAGSGYDGQMGVSGGSSYGTKEGITVQTGSRGGDNGQESNLGGYGGGAISLIAQDITISGNVYANGSNGKNTSVFYGAGGGGSGGGILLNCRNLAVNGAISANGGNGGTYDEDGGGGGGGRIKIHALELNIANATMTAQSGSGYRSGSTGTVWKNSYPTSPTLKRVVSNAQNPPTLKMVSSDPDGNASLTYKIEISKDGFSTIYKTFDQGMNPANWSSSSYSSGDTAMYTPAQVFPDGNYQWRAYAFDGYVYSDGWNIDNPVPDTYGTFAFDTSAPTGLPTTPTDAGEWSTFTSLTFTWTPGTVADAQSNIAGYQIKVGTTPGAGDVFDGPTGNVTQFTLDGCEDGGTYYACVAAVNGAGLVGSFSESSDGITIDASAAPVEMISSNTHPDSGQWYAEHTFMASWNAPIDVNGITGFYFRTSIYDTATLTVNDSLLYQNNLQLNLPDGEWYLHLASCDGLGNIGPVTLHYPIRIDSEAPTLMHNGVTLAYQSTPVTVSGTVSDNLTKITLHLFFRVKGQTGWQESILENASNFFTLDIPSDFITAQGVEYYLAAMDQAENRTTFPENNPETSPYEISNILVDEQAPSAPRNVLANGDNPSPWQQGSSFSIQWSNPADVTGINKIYWKLGVAPSSPDDTTGSAPAVSPLLLDIEQQGGQSVYLWLSDNAGNCDHTKYAEIICKRDVTAPQISNLVVPNPVPENTDLEFTLDLFDYVGITSADLYYKRCGDTGFQHLPLARTESGYKVTIPANHVTKNGIHYYLYTSDSLGNSASVPDLGNGQIGDYIPVQFSTLEMTSPLPKDRWEMFSVPAQPNDGAVSTLFSELGDYDKTQWRLFKYDNEYIEYGSDEFTEILPGQAYWLYTRNPDLKLSAGEGQSVTVENGIYTITLQPGWNDIANPFTFSIFWPDILAVNSDAGNLVGPYTYRENFWQTPAEVNAMAPWSGYAIKNLSPSPMQLHLPAFAANTQNVSKANTTEQAIWTCNISARCGQALDLYNKVQIHNLANQGYDKMDYPEPPAQPGEQLSIAFPHPDWQDMPGIYTSDSRPPQTDPEQGQIWAFTVQGSVKEKVTLAFDASGQSPQAMRLVDIESNVWYDLSKTQTVETMLHKDGTARQFTLVTGSAEYVQDETAAYQAVPNTFVLEQNYPNPFNANTLVQYQVPQAGRVRIDIYNINGQWVRTLQDASVNAGQYTLKWDGGDQNGMSLSTGLYLCRMQCEGYNHTVKMLLVK